MIAGFDGEVMDEDDPPARPNPPLGAADWNCCGFLGGRGGMRPVVRPGLETPSVFDIDVVPAVDFERCKKGFPGDVLLGIVGKVAHVSNELSLDVLAVTF